MSDVHKIEFHGNPEHFEVYLARVGADPDEYDQLVADPGRALSPFVRFYDEHGNEAYLGARDIPAQSEIADHWPESRPASNPSTHWKLSEAGRISILHTFPHMRGLACLSADPTPPDSNGPHQHPDGSDDQAV